MGGAPSLILPGLWQGGSDVLDQPEFFEKNKITHSVSICNVVPHNRIKLTGRLHYNKDDLETVDLSAHFSQIALFIHGCRVNGGVCYVHCHAGISRSSTATISYLMASLSLSFEVALAFLSKRRSTVCPNPGFVKQLKRYQNTNRDDVTRLLRNKYPQGSALVARDMDEIRASGVIGRSGMVTHLRDQVKAALAPQKLEGKKAGGEVGLEWLDKSESDEENTPKPKPQSVGTTSSKRTPTNKVTSNNSRRLVSAPVNNLSLPDAKSQPTTPGRNDGLKEKDLALQGTRSMSNIERTIPNNRLRVLHPLPTNPKPIRKTGLPSSP